MSNRVKINSLAAAIMDGLNEYASLATDDIKQAVKDAGKTVLSEIKDNAPKDTGWYAKSWTVKTTRETDHSFELTVHSRTKYQLAHLLEFGHAKRNGGRVAGQAHIAPAEEIGAKKLEDDIKRRLENG